MTSKNKLVPRSPNEVVVPVGKASLITTQEKIDEALEIASHIFRQQNEEKKMEMNDLAKELDTKIEIDSNGNEIIKIQGEASEKLLTMIEDNTEELTELTDEQVSNLPSTKYGRDKYGRVLNKDSSPRQPRSDKGIERGKYGPRKSKVE